ncbi:MAG: sigma-E processing peptidase SpoIIGA [Oscillospiraceae bacterium]|jgi:stage II sporulation protein GA (sporulation sigma-E factor processing peptidase)
MKIVYADDMFVLNLLIDYFILLATAKLCALPLRRGRFLLAAAFGALYAVLLLWAGLRPMLATPCAKLGLGILMTLMAYGTEPGIWRPYAVFLLVSAAFGGAVYAASLLAGVRPEDGLFGSVSMRVLALSFAVCYCTLTFFFRRFGKRAVRETHQIEVTLCGRTASFTALADTGNELYDPISGLSVMVVGKKEVEKLLPPVLADALNDGPAVFMEALPYFDALRPRFRLIPYSSVGRSAGLLPVFRPDRVLLDGKTSNMLLVGLCPNDLSTSGEFSAIF